MNRNTLQTLRLASVSRARALAVKAAVIGSGLLASGVALAQETDPFTTAMTAITTKVGTYGAALVGLSAVAVAFYIGIKFVKKIPKAA